MNQSPNRLYELLPAIYRIRDAEQGEPLQALLRVITEQVNAVEGGIAQLYENWFIETCEDWVVPYIGDLVGYQVIHEAGEPSDVAKLRDRLRERILIPRRDVANTIRYRRRKGTLALLELLAQDAAGWPARTAEFYTLLGWTQHVNHLWLTRGRTVDLRNGHALDLLDSPFDTLAHTVDVRRITSRRAPGRHNIPSVGVFLWRLQSFSVKETPAYCLEEEGPQCYTFSVLGNDTPLYNRPEPETEPTHIADELNLPTPIRRRAFEERILVHGHIDRTQASDKYYGKSVTIVAPGWPRKGEGQPIPRQSIIPADLTNWHYRAPRNFVAVDPQSGRIVFPAGQLPKGGVVVSYQYAFSANIGGGEYDRPLAQPAGSQMYYVSQEEKNKDRQDYCGTIQEAIQKAIDRWKQDKQALDNYVKSGAPSDTMEIAKPKPLPAVIEITDSKVYTERLNIAVPAGQSLQIRAANHARPIIRLLDYLADRPDAFTMSGAPGSRLTLDGLLITGRGLQVTGPESNATDGATSVGDLCDLTIRHCTLVPGWGLHCDCEPKRPNEPSLELINTGAQVKIEHSIIGSIQVAADEVQSDPMRIHITDSIIDATSKDRVALGAANRPLAYATLTVARCTVIGQIQTHAIALAENCIFNGVILVGRRQHGCVRFCYVTPGSRTPRRYECQPDLVENAAVDGAEKERERMRVEPQFNSVRYGTPTYCQLTQACADEIARGAEDEAEMGAFHDLYQPQRAANLRARLDEYTPAGMEAGILYAS